MNTNIHCLLLLTVASTLCSCAQPTSNDSASINMRRSNPYGITSEQRLTQNRRQRTNEVEEARAQRELRGHQRDEILSPLKTFNEAAGLVRSIGFYY